MALLHILSPSPPFSRSARRRVSHPLSATSTAVTVSTSTLTQLHTPSTSPPSLVLPAGGSGSDDKSDFYLNLGAAVRTLREDLPALFVRDLNYDIYRDDITFMDPMNTFSGIMNYKLIFWALRFHGKILFRSIRFQVLRIWQPSDYTILIRWTLKGVPRVPWEAQGEFQGTSRYKLDRKGKIYEHKVDNLAFNFPRLAMKPTTVLDLVVTGAACPSPATPNLPFMEGLLMDDQFSCSWIELYRAVRETLIQEGTVEHGRNDLMILTYS